MFRKALIAATALVAVPALCRHPGVATAGLCRTGTRHVGILCRPVPRGGSPTVLPAAARLELRNLPHGPAHRHGPPRHHRQGDIARLHPAQTPSGFAIPPRSRNGSSATAATRSVVRVRRQKRPT